MPRVISIGRFVFHTEGLLFLTNDCALACIGLPSNGLVAALRVGPRAGIARPT